MRSKSFYGALLFLSYEIGIAQVAKHKRSAPNNIYISYHVSCLKYTVGGEVLRVRLVFLLSSFPDVYMMVYV